MTTDTKKLDFAQRIVEILQRTSEPLPTVNNDINSGDVIMGTLPMHLRHLHNLLVEVTQEKDEAILRMHEVKASYNDQIYQDKVAYKKVNNAYQCVVDAHVLCKAIHFILLDALRHHFPISETDYTGIKITHDWQVAASKEIKENDNSDCTLH